MARTAHKNTEAMREEEEESGSDSDIVARGQRDVFQTTDGEPICFMFHSSLTPGQQKKLEKMITEHGGMVMETEDGVDTIIVSGTHPNFERIQRQYGCSKSRVKRKIHVERPSFIRICISRNRFFHRVPSKKGLGGPRRSRKVLVRFTTDDAYHLAQYIASRRPDKASGGRSGNLLYKELVDLAPSDEEYPAEYAWVRRHTWHSWRERYVKDKARMNVKIDEFVAALPPEERVVDPRDIRVRRKGGDSSRASSDTSSSQSGEDDELEYESLPELPRDTGETKSRQQRQPGRDEVENRRDSRTVHKGRGPLSASGSQPKRQGQGKGKGRADTPVDSEDSDNDSLFDGEFNMTVIDGPGPSGTQRQSSPRASQQTLVGTHSSQRNAAAHKATLHQPNRKRPHTSQPVSHTENQSAVEVDESPASHPRLSRESVNVINKTKSSAEGRKAVRRKVVEILSAVDNNSPYRNTRSRSLELVALAAKKAIRSRQQKGTSILPVIEDSIVEEAEGFTLAPIGETAEEEKDVMDQLFENDHSMLENDEIAEVDDLSHIPHVAVPGEHRSEGKRLDSDDQQTHNALHNSAGLFSDDDELSESGVLSNMQKANAFLRRPSHDRSPKQARRDLGRARDTTAQKLITPRRKKHHSGSSTNSISYPSPGTRAFKMKGQLEMHEKGILYVPPPGTRAAALKK